MSRVAWGIISTGRIAGVFANGVKGSETGELLAVASRDQEKADKFGGEHGIERRYASYEALLADPDVQAVYIATPHPMHAEWAIKAAEAGKHILCEKPLTLDYAQAAAVVDAARLHDVFLMEAFMYLSHPHTAKLYETVAGGAIGEVRIIQATFSFNAGYNPEGRLFKNALGGGGILDVGCYCTSMARLIAGAANGKPYDEPTEIKAMGHIGETGADEYAVATMRFENDILARVYTGVRLSQDNVVRIYGTDGNIFVPAPWNPTRDPGTARFIVNRAGKEPEEVTTEAAKFLYSYEADAFAAGIADGKAAHPCMTPEETLGNMRTCDLWRAGIGQIYDIEKPDADFPTADGRPLEARPGNRMKYGRLPGLDKPVSREIMGIPVAPTPYLAPYASVLYDEFFRYGGNCFDTAYIYGGGQVDRTLGQWIRNRGVREQVSILAKGAHTPHCNPESLTSQLMETLERLQTDYVDIYMMHRDNPEVPVGEFVDVLNEHHRAGRIRVFGGSNWSIERFEEANAYAKSKGLMPFVGLNNNFSLARMVEAPWGGCIASADEDSKSWFEKTQTPLLAWSSLAKGFFVRGDRNRVTEGELVNCWYAEDNFMRLDRARELAVKKGAQPVQIALAWVLHQPFPTWALVGPGNLHEMRVSTEALDIELTPEEVKWLNLEL